MHFTFDLPSVPGETQVLFPRIYLTCMRLLQLCPSLRLLLLSQLQRLHNNVIFAVNMTIMVLYRELEDEKLGSIFLESCFLLF